ncbi:MAG: TonB-dependent receptor [Sphingomonadales bacterium]|nr:TonB-dependent receptor [Sphingomonadales bacterium]
MTALFHDSIRRAGSMRNLLLASVGAASLLSMPAYAQTAPADEESGEIFVTARKNTEALQDVPVTVTAVTGETLENFGANQVQDVAGRVPTLNVQVGGSGSGGSISLRGVGSSAISASFDSAVAFDFDGVVQSSMRLVQAGFFDVKQIDVLKGPQSLFFGKSASAGVFSLHSADPTKSWEVGGKASYEFQERGYVIGGYLSGPLTDSLGIRIAAQYNDVSRYNQIQPGVGTVNPNRGLKDFVGRVTLAWEPSDRFKANLKLNYITNRNDGASQFLDIYCGFNGRADEVVLLSGAIAIPNAANCNNKDKYFAIPDPAASATGKFPAGSAGVGRYPGHPFGRTNIYFGRLKWDLDLTDTLTISSTTGLMKLDSIDFDSYSYAGTGPAFSPIGVPKSEQSPRRCRSFCSNMAINGVGVPLGMVPSDPRNKTYQFSQEYRLASDFEGPFNFQLGAFYEYRKIDFNTSQQAVNISIIAPDPITGNTYDYYKKHQTKTNTVSFFGSASYDITEQLELSGGLRWTDEKKVNTIRVPYVHTFLVGPAFLAGGFYSGPIRFKDSNVSPEVSLRYKVTPDVSIYAAYKTGFKSGGIDNSALPSNSLSAAALSGDFSSLIYKSETAKGGEIGAKMQFADRTLTLNVSAFDYIFKNLQLQNFNSTTVQFVTFNASELTSKGADLDFAWKTPVEGLRLSGGLAYTDAKFTKDLIIARNPDPAYGLASENLKGRSFARS